MKRKYFSVLFLAFICLACFISNDKTIKVMKNLFGGMGDGEERKVFTVVIDAGHGGRDPGKVGINGALEKDINLSIAFKLRELLELNDVNVVMIREEDIGLYSETDTNKKNADLKKRVDIIHRSKADFAISIHQNSFQEEYVKGAQVFYHGQSTDGKRLAEILQEQITDTVKDGNHRKAKANDSYYMLRKSNCPLVIIECGYLSNYAEANLLVDEAYQEKMAWAIHLGIMRYINQELNK